MRLLLTLERKRTTVVMRPLLLTLTALLFSLTLLAHEYILLAYQYFLRPGDTLEVHLFVSDGFNIQLERPLQRDATMTFALETNQGTTDLLEQVTDGNLPVLEREVDFEGQGLLHMSRDWAYITLPTGEFADYLAHDNIENIALDTTRTEQKERYCRDIKALVQSTPLLGDTLYRRMVGQEFELVPLSDPYTAGHDEWLRFRVYFRGQPLADKVITARNRRGAEAATEQYSRTDAEGICSFKLERGGEWFVHATHMLPSPAGAGTDYDSFWTTYSFGLRGD